MVPRLSRVATLADPNRSDFHVYERAATEAAKTLRVDFRMVPVRHEGEFEAAGSRTPAILTGHSKIDHRGIDHVPFEHGERRFRAASAWDLENH